MSAQSKPDTKAKAKTKTKTKTKTIKPMLFADEKRLAKLNAIKDKLVQGKHVQKRDLQRWLTKDEFEAIDLEWVGELERREDMYENKPACIAEYESRLKKIIFKTSRADDYSRKGIAQTAKKFTDEADAEMESLLEWLSETYQEDKSIMAWFDRDVSDALSINEKLDLSAMPRTITSRSSSRENGIRQRTIADIKLMVVDSAIRSLKPTAAKTAQSKKLQELLGLPLQNIEDL